MNCLLNNMMLKDQDHLMKIKLGLPNILQSTRLIIFSRIWKNTSNYILINLKPLPARLSIWMH